MRTFNNSEETTLIYRLTSSTVTTRMNIFLAIDWVRINCEPNLSPVCQHPIQVYNR
nr:MAG TPA: hypothetical protein [Caudoviricetes sp.]